MGHESALHLSCAYGMHYLRIAGMPNRMEIVRVNEAEGAKEIYSKVVRAGRRTYFFDVKATRADDYFLTITESRKMADQQGSPYYEKHKIHLYKEDFEKYIEGLNTALDYIRDSKPQFFTKENGFASEKENNTAPNGKLTIDEEFEKL